MKETCPEGNEMVMHAIATGGLQEHCDAVILWQLLCFFILEGFAFLFFTLLPRVQYLQKKTPTLYLLQVIQSDFFFVKPPSETGCQCNPLAQWDYLFSA